MTFEASTYRTVLLRCQSCKGTRYQYTLVGESFRFLSRNKDKTHGWCRPAVEMQFTVRRVLSKTTCQLELRYDHSALSQYRFDRRQIGPSRCIKLSCLCALLKGNSRRFGAIVRGTSKQAGKLRQCELPITANGSAHFKHAAYHSFADSANAQGRIESKLRCPLRATGGPRTCTVAP